MDIGRSSCGNPKAMARWSCVRLATCQQFPGELSVAVCFISIFVFRWCFLYHHSVWLNMDTVQFADGSSLIMSGSRGGDRGSGPPPPPNVLTRPSGRKRILISTFAVRMQRLHFCLWRRFYVLLAVECLWMIKLNKTIISVLVYADTIKASLYFQLKCYFSNYKSVL